MQPKGHQSRCTGSGHLCGDGVLTLGLFIGAQREVVVATILRENGYKMLRPVCGVLRVGCCVSYVVCSGRCQQCAVRRAVGMYICVHTDMFSSRGCACNQAAIVVCYLVVLFLITSLSSLTDCNRTITC